MTARSTFDLREWICADHHVTYVRATETLDHCLHMNHGRPCQAAVRPADKRPTRPTKEPNA